MLRKSPLNRAREKPRRNEGRITHVRMKPKAKIAPQGQEKQHIARVAAMPCLVCGRKTSVHHVMNHPEKIRRRDHRFVVPLCYDHHQGDEGVHGLGSEAKFTERWGIDLAKTASRLWEESCKECGAG